jgi:thiamine-phosphate pyrophosphorylase
VTDPGYSRETLRIIDANLNRAAEGLRVLEDTARLGLNDAALSQRLKALRHELTQTTPALQERLIAARAAGADVGRDIEVAGESKDRDLAAAVIANSRRAQESLRVLEEMAPASGGPGELSTDRFRQARFAVYTLEQELLGRLTRQNKLSRLAGLYAVLDMDALGGRDPMEVAGQVIRGGARAVQLRDKRPSRRELFEIAVKLRRLCAETGTLFIVNDYLDIALASDADGLHIGQEDLPADVARRLLPLGKLLGVSVMTVAEARTAQAAGADYLGVGAIYATPSKEVSGIVGPARLTEIKRAVPLPLVAIGGITAERAPEVIRFGASGVAVISAILGATSPEAAARSIAKAIEATK